MLCKLCTIQDVADVTYDHEGAKKVEKGMPVRKTCTLIAFLRNVGQLMRQLVLMFTACICACDGAAPI